MTGWQLSDAETVADLRNFVGRAQRLDAGGAARVVGVGTALAVYVAALHGNGLPTVLGLRVAALAMPDTRDVVVPLAALADRLARPENGTVLPVPPQQVHVGWAGALPPRTGWVGEDPLAATALVATADQGIAQIAAPGESGGTVDAELRSRVWGRDLPGAPGVPAGSAFGLVAFGFVSAGLVQRFSCGPWTRLTTPSGHVLARRPLW